MKLNYYRKMINSFVVLLGAHLFLTSFVQLQPVNGQEINRIRLSEVQVITLYKDQYTNARQMPIRPQLKCIGISWMCHMYSPSMVQCLNRGYDGVDVQWECKANMDKTVKFGTIKVICEGYNYPEDPFILAGSCSLEYRLETASKTNRYEFYPNHNMYETNKLSNFLTLLIMVVIILAVYKTCNKSRENEIRREINSTYAHIIDGPDFTPYAHNPSSMSAHSASMFPPPPPPYGSVVANLPVNTTINTSLLTTGTTTGQTTANPNGNINNSNNINNNISVSLNPNNQHLSNTAESTMPSTTSSDTQTDLKPENCVNNPNSNNPSQANMANDSSTATLRNSSSSSWGNFLASTTVGGYIFNRRYETRRSDSPPPAYEDARGENALLQSNANTTFVSSSSSSSRR